MENKEEKDLKKKRIKIIERLIKQAREKKIPLRAADLLRVVEEELEEGIVE